MLYDIAWVCFFILSTGEGVDESLDCSRVAPLHGRVGHAGQRHVEIKQSAQNPADPKAKNYQPFDADLARIPSKLDHSADATQAKHPKYPAFSYRPDEKHDRPRKR